MQGHTRYKYFGRPPSSYSYHGILRWAGFVIDTNVLAGNVIGCTVSIVYNVEECINVGILCISHIIIKVILSAIGLLNLLHQLSWLINNENLSKLKTKLVCHGYPQPCCL